jgi:GNAT superfamily N-acetyltransferase
VTVEVRQVPAAATASLRQRVLRPHQTIEEMSLEGEEAAVYFGALEGGALLSTARVNPEPPPWEPGAAGWWRLRGMATEPARRSEGLGGLVLAVAVDFAGDSGAVAMWCSARVPAVDFYRRAGFETRGGEWDEPPIGPHILMFRRL